MKVTALVTTYNYARFVVEAVESVLAQDYEGEIECIVVDDGSTDDTPQRLAPYLDRIKYIRRENGGQAAAFNTGFAASTGDVVCYLDADDWWMPGKVSAVAEVFRKNPRAGLVHHPLELVDAENRHVDKGGNPVAEPVYVPTISRPANGDVTARLLREDFPWLFSYTSGLAFTRTALEICHPLLEGFKGNADAFAAYPVALIRPVAYIDRALGYYTVHKDNFSSYRGADQAKWAAEQLAYFDFLYRHIETVLKRTGRGINLHPEGSWRHVKLHSMANRRPPLAYLPRGIGELWARKHITPGVKLRQSWKMAAKALERSVRGKYTGSAIR